jgi:recombination protein RecR
MKISLILVNKLNRLIIPSKYLENAVDQIASLPGIGRRTALRLALNLLNRTELEITDFSNSIIDLKKKIRICKNCGNISDQELCPICLNPNRDQTTICVVEDIRDVMAIESTASYQGIYHVLGGLISPMDGISPHDLNIESLVEKVASGLTSEIIFALSPTMEGDTTNFYLYKKLQKFSPLITALSRGVSVGAELQYVDELTLSRSIQQRQEFKTH